MRVFHPCFAGRMEEGPCDPESVFEVRAKVRRLGITEEHVLWHGHGQRARPSSKGLFGWYGATIRESGLPAVRAKGLGATFAELRLRLSKEVCF